MPTYTTTYSLGKPVVGADEDAWGDTLNASLDSIDDILDGTTPITGIDINSGTLDGVTIGGTTAGAGTFTTLTANTSITGTLATAAQTNITSVGTLTGLTVSASASLAGASTSADITFGDNDKAIFGAGSDLQIYHDGSNSIIHDDGTGDLQIQANNLRLTNQSTTRTYAEFINAGSANLYHDNALKFNTTSTGVDITGTLTSDLLTVNGIVRVDENDPQIRLLEDDTTDLNTQIRLQGGVLDFKNLNDAEDAAYKRLSIDNANGDISFYEDTGTTAKFFWDASAEALGIGTSSPSTLMHISGSSASADGIHYIAENTRGAGGPAGIVMKSNHGDWKMINSQTVADALEFIDGSAGITRMLIDSSGNLLVGTTDSTPYNNSAGTSADNGIALGATGLLSIAKVNDQPLILNRTGSDGGLLRFNKNGSAVGTILTISGAIQIVTGTIGIGINDDNLYPTDGSGNSTDNVLDVGDATARWDDVYATNGTIQTSDQNEKQQIASLTDAEMTAAKAISKLFKTFKWNDSVAEKGDAARTHSGVIAQDVEQAMTDAGLDAGDYAFFISTTWWETQTEVPAVEADEENGVEAQEAYTRTDTYDTLEEAPEGATERNRKGIRYPQLLSFIGAATEQRLASIETRLDALEA